MLAVESATAPPPFRKQSIFRRFTKKEERPLQISRPIIKEASPTHTPPSPRSPRKLVRRSTIEAIEAIEAELDRVPATAPVLPPLNTKPIQGQKAKIVHIRKDSGTGTFSDLPISQQFSRAQAPSPTHSQHLINSNRSTNSNRSSNSSRSSTDSTSSTHSRIPRNAHATSPFPHNTRIGPWNLFLPPSQVHALYTGFFPEDMAAKWFVFSEGPDVNGKLKVHFHRAWTGLKVAELFVVMDLKGEGAGKVVGIKWNESEQTGRMGEGDAKRTIRGSCYEALGFELEGESFV